MSAHDIAGAEEFVSQFLIQTPTNGLSLVKQTISDLLQNKVDMSPLVITKVLAKTGHAGRQVHVELADA